MNITLKDIEVLPDYWQTEETSKKRYIVNLYADSDYGEFFASLSNVDHKFLYSEDVKEIRDRCYRDTLRQMLKHLLKQTLIEGDRV